MAASPKLDLVEQSATTDITVIIAKDHAVALLDREKFNAWYEKLKADAPIDADVSTNKGRDVLRSYAATVRSDKAAIDKDRLRLTKEWRDLTSQVNAAGKEIETQLEALAVEVRAPLTAWEDAEKARDHRCQVLLTDIAQSAVISLDDTADMVRTRGAEVWNTELDPEMFGDGLVAAQAVKDQAVAALRSALARLTKEEADRAELEKLRADNETRAAKERAETEAREQAEREAESARQEEARKIAAERADAQRIADAEKAAAEKARRESEEKHAAELAAEREKLAAVEREAQAERDHLAEIERQRSAREAAVQREAEAAAADQARREANQRHVSSVMRGAKEAVMACGVDELVAKAIVIAIKGGMIPAVTIAF